MAAHALNLLTYKPISLWVEMGAYEALWVETKAWFKSIAEKFREHPGALPSDFFAMHQDSPRAIRGASRCAPAKGRREALRHPIARRR